MSSQIADIPKIGIRQMEMDKTAEQYSLPRGDNDEIFVSNQELRIDNISIKSFNDIKYCVSMNGKEENEFTAFKSPSRERQTSSDKNKICWMIESNDFLTNRLHEQNMKDKCKNGNIIKLDELNGNVDKQLSINNSVLSYSQDTFQINNQTCNNTPKDSQTNQEYQQDKGDNTRHQETSLQRIMINSSSLHNQAGIEKEISTSQQKQDGVILLLKSEGMIRQRMARQQRTNNLLVNNQVRVNISEVQIKTKQEKSKGIRVSNQIKHFIQLLKNQVTNRQSDSLTTIQRSLINDCCDLSKQYEIRFFQRVMAIDFILQELQKWMNNTTSHLVIMPSDTFKIVWDSIQVIFNFSFLYVYSILLFFAQQEVNMKWFNYVYYLFLFLLLTDILIKFNSSYYVNDQIVIQRTKIFSHYTKTYFIFDFLCVLQSLNTISNSTHNSFFYNPNHNIWHYLTNLLIFARTIAIYHKTAVYDNIQQLSNSQRHLIRLINQLLFMITFAHIMGIAWYMLGQIQEIYGFQVYWLVKLNQQSLSWFSKYIYSFYWAVTTMTTVGYGDIIPLNSLEALFCSFSMVLFSCVFAYSINNIGMILYEIDKSSKEMKDNIITMQRYLIRRNVNSTLRNRITQYLMFLGQESKDKNKKEEDRVIGILSNKLRDELTQEVNTKMMKACSLFGTLFSQTTLKNLVRCIKEIQVSPNEIIFNQNDVGNQAIYFVLDGEIEIFCEHDKQKTIFAVVGSHQYFGEASFFSGFSRIFSARSLKLSTLFQLSREEFLSIIQLNTEDFQRYKMLEEQFCVNDNQTNLNLLGCHSCRSLSHFSPFCPQTHLVLDKQKTILKYNFFQFQERRLHKGKQRRKSSLLDTNKTDCCKLKVFFSEQGGHSYERVKMYSVQSISSSSSEQDYYSEQETITDNNSSKSKSLDDDLSPRVEALQKLNEKQGKSSKSSKIESIKQNILYDNFEEREEFSKKTPKTSDNIERRFSQFKNTVLVNDNILFNTKSNIITFEGCQNEQIGDREEPKKQLNFNPLHLIKDDSLLLSLPGYMQNASLCENQLENKQMIKQRISMKKPTSNDLRRADIVTFETENQRQSLKSKHRESSSKRHTNTTEIKDIPSLETIFKTLSPTQDMKESIEDRANSKFKTNRTHRGNAIDEDSKSRQMSSLQYLTTKLSTISSVKEEEDYHTKCIESKQNELNSQFSRKLTQEGSKRGMLNTLISCLLHSDDTKQFTNEKTIYSNIFNLFTNKKLMPSQSNVKLSTTINPLYDFDKMFIFSKFFPHNNADNVLLKLKLKPRQNNKFLNHPKNLNRRQHILQDDFLKIQNQIKKLNMENQIFIQDDHEMQVLKYRPTVISYGISTKNTNQYPIKFEDKHSFIHM